MPKYEKKNIIDKFMSYYSAFRQICRLSKTNLFRVLPDKRQIYLAELRGEWNLFLPNGQFGKKTVHLDIPPLVTQSVWSSFFSSSPLMYYFHCFSYLPTCSYLSSQCDACAMYAWWERGQMFTAGNMYVCHCMWQIKAWFTDWLKKVI